MPPPPKRNQAGFTLIELIIVVAIVGILSSFAISSYQSFVKKTHFSQIILLTDSVKKAVELCAQMKGSLSDCTMAADAHINKTVFAILNGTTLNSFGFLHSGAYSTTLKATPRRLNGIEPTETYDLVGTLNNGKISWKKSETSGCIASGAC